MKILLFGMLLVAVPATAQTKFYVDPNFMGAARNGQPSNPWQSLNDGSAWQTINNALASSPVNVYFTARQAGSDTEVRTAQVILLNRTNLSTNRLYLSGNEFYNTSESTPSWNAYTGTNKFHVSTTGTAPALDTNNSGSKTLPPRNFITIHGFKFNTSGQIVLLLNASNLIYEFNEAFANPGSSIGPGTLIGQTIDGNNIPTNGNNWSRHVVWRNNYTHDTFGEGLYVEGSTADPPGAGNIQTGDDILIDHNVFLNCGKSGTNDGDCIDIKDGNTNVRITNNTINFDATYSGASNEQCQGMTLESVTLVDSNTYNNTAPLSMNCRNGLVLASAWNNSFGRTSAVNITNNVLVGNNTNVAGIRAFSPPVLAWGLTTVSGNSLCVMGSQPIDLESGFSSVAPIVTNNIISSTPAACGTAPQVPVITSPTSVSGVTGTPFAYQITATNNPTSFSATGLPSPLSVNASGLISGTPATAGSFTVTLGATNSAGTGTGPLNLTVTSSVPVTNTTHCTSTITCTNGVCNAAMACTQQ